MFENYAKLLIQVGLHVKRNQIVVIQAPVEVYSFVEALSQEAFRAGAKDVIVRYRDEIISHHRYLYADDVEKVPSYVSDLYNQTAKKGACYLYLVGDDPNLMKDVDPKKFTNYRKAFRKDTAFYRHQLDFMHCQWCVAAVATRSWSKQIYGHEDTHRLWQDILRICHVDEKDPVDTWEKRKQQFEKRVNWINSLELRSLHYRNHLGTDLMVELPEHYRFAGGNSLLIDGTSYFANIPTEEIFAAPLKKGIQGKLVASMPLSHQGTLIKDFWFQFKDGKVIDFDAKEGKQVLAEILSTDAGSSYIGEIALVPYDSPISNYHQIFYETLIDENASCHFAFGQSYPECIEKGLSMTSEELKEHGLNQSNIHVDFMVGTKDLQIEGKTRKGEEITIFQNGNFPWFD
ncbi:MAG: aminopeptidase [Absicoccus sp.]|uniref:aminopeptidase n=1 Tax=Absicoccus sp. TaxID=2718527 RepID=UPI002A75BA96|nr:aminopeptidase [Absicoccus sp.]MDY3036678.1 aminopeptidase [Absicoccus sp.]